MSTDRDDRIDRIRNLTAASDRIQACASVEEMAAEVCRHAARLTEAGLAIATVVPDGDWTAAHSTGWYIEGELAAETGPVVIDGTGLEAEVCRSNRTVRTRAADLEATPEGRDAARGSRYRPALLGWLAAPLCTRDGRNIGLVQVSRRCSGDFTAMDEAVLEALAHTASVAIDKARVYALAAEQEVARFREEILAGMSHDMQTPLAAIGGIIDLLSSGVVDEEERSSLHAALGRQHRNLRAMVQRFLDFSRL
ncbi:MAG: GAF domain-containing protein, partial [Actinobacteria bacterium]|nr:GAF domain-containing protein [Actinomycetota bacterium]